MKSATQDIPGLHGLVIRNALIEAFLIHEDRRIIIEKRIIDGKATISVKAEPI